MLTTILLMMFNFHTVTIVGNEVITTSSNTTYKTCSFNLGSADIIQDIAESEGECFDKSITSIY